MQYNAVRLIVGDASEVEALLAEQGATLPPGAVVIEDERMPTYPPGSIIYYEAAHHAQIAFPRLPAELAILFTGLQDTIELDTNGCLRLTTSQALIPGLPLEDCPGPYFAAGALTPASPAEPPQATPRYPPPTPHTHRGCR